MTRRAAGWLRGDLTRGSVFSLLQSLTGIVAYFLAMRLLIAEEGTIAVGLWSLTVGIVAIIRLVDISGGAGLARMVAVLQDDRNAKRYMVDTVTLFILAFHLAVVAITFFPLEFAIGGMVPAAQAALARELVIWAALILIVTVLGGAQAAAIDGLHKVDVRSMIMVAGSVIFGGVALYAIPRWGVRGMALAQLIQAIAIVIGTRAALIILLPGLHIWPRWLSRRVLREALPYGAKMQAASVPILIYEPLARVVINSLAGLHVLATYDLAYKFCVYTRNFIQAAGQPLIPALARSVVDDRREADRLFSRSSRLFLIAGVTIFTGVGLASPLISHLLLGTVSMDFVNATIVMALASMVGTAAYVPSILGQATGHLRWNIAGQWSIAALTMTIIPLAAVILGTNWVIAGTAVAVAAGYAVIIGGNLWEWRRFRQSQP